MRCIESGLCGTVDSRRDEEGSHRESGSLQASSKVEKACTRQGAARQCGMGYWSPRQVRRWLSQCSVSV